MTSQIRRGSAKSPKTWVVIKMGPPYIFGQDSRGHSIDMGEGKKQIHSSDARTSGSPHG